MKNDKYWTDYWQKEGQSGEVLVSQDGSKPLYLTQFWQVYFSQLAIDSVILDMACGGGSIYQALPNKHQFTLYGADISAQALSYLTQNISEVKILQCASDQVPLESDSIDAIVSQFGVEYSGTSGFKEAVRLLKPEGCFTFISHYQGGIIDAGNQQQLAGILLAKELRFIDKARALTKVVYNDNQADFDIVFAEFSSVEPKLHDYTQQCAKGLHAHLYHGFRKMLTNREKYHGDDVIIWLDNIAAELEVNLIRLQSMCDAACSARDLEQLKTELVNIVDFDFTAFYGESDTVPLAWHISGKKGSL